MLFLMHSKFLSVMHAFYYPLSIPAVRLCLLVGAFRGRVVLAIGLKSLTQTLGVECHPLPSSIVFSETKPNYFPREVRAVF